VIRVLGGVGCLFTAATGLLGSDARPRFGRDPYVVADNHFFRVSP
jgi:hypothetical protein